MIRQKKVAGTEPKSVEELLGLAQGCIGMSREDFAACTPDEFKAIYDAWYHRDEALMHRSWEVGRFAAAVTLQPYSNKPIKPKSIFRFPWEKESAGCVKGTSTRKRAQEIAGRLARKKIIPSVCCASRESKTDPSL